jgi:DGQHR domain-containing protein
MTTRTFPALVPRQSNKYVVFSFCANVTDVLRFARIDRIGRREDGTVRGFQRPQVAAHIKEIRQYLSHQDSVLPNAVVVAFTHGVTLQEGENGIGSVQIDMSGDPPGFIVDGQQRLSALQGLPERDFEVLVSGLLCSGEDELRKQFILINNTRPLPKQLIYELLPTVDGLPHRLSSRSAAAALVERLNFDETSSLHGQIKQHTNPTGTLQDTTLQKVIMASLTDGALRELSRLEDGTEHCFQLLSNFFQAVQNVFSEAWVGHNPKTSRLVHSVGIMAMGYAMEHIHATQRAIDVSDFEPTLQTLKGTSAWTSGTWEFGEGNRRPWNSLQFVPRDYMELSQFLIRQLKASRPQSR